MNLQQALEVRRSQKALIDKRNALNNALMINDQVYNGNIGKTLEATGLNGWKAAHTAYNNDKIGQEWFDFIDQIKKQKAEINAALNNLPSIPMELHKEMRTVL